MRALTDRQRHILAAIRDHIAETGDAPTVREIGQAVGLKSSSSVVYQFRRLEGFLPAGRCHDLLSAAHRLIIPGTYGLL